MAELPPAPPAIRLTTLGSLELRAGDAPVLPGRRKVLALLAYLARRSPRLVSREELASLLWGDRDEAHARQSLRRALSELRAGIGDALEGGEGSVRVRPGSLALDVAGFELAAREGPLDQAATRWTGEFLGAAEDLGSGEWRTWLEGERAVLHAQLARTFAALVAREEAAGDTGAAATWARRWSEALPWDEDAAARARVLASRPAAPPHPPSGPAGPGRKGLLSPALVGRDAALARLTAAWRAAARGTPAVAVIEADDGHGKSRMVQELGRLVRRTDPQAVVLEARAYASDQGRDRSTLGLLARQLASAPGLGTARPAALAALVSLAPELRERLPGLPEADPRVAAEDAFAEVIGALGVDHPVLILLDDAPLADTASLQAIARLLHQPPPRTLLVLTARQWALAESPLATDLRQASLDLVTVPLPPLGESEVAALVESMAPLAPATRPDLPPALREASGGVPGLVVELLAGLAEEGGLATDDTGRWRLTRPVEVLAQAPLPSVREAAIARLRRLEPGARAVLEAAAVAGPGASPTALESVSGLAPPAFQEAMADLLLRRLLRHSPTSPGGLEFTSEAMGRTVHELLAPSSRRALTRRWRRATGAAPRWWVGASVAVVAGLVAIGLFTVRRGDADAVGPAARLVVVEFENETGDRSLDWLGRVAADWLSQGIARTSLVRVSPPLLRSPPGRENPGTGARARAHALARAAEADLVVSGSYYRSGDSIHFRAALARVDEAKLLQVVGPQGAPAGEALGAIDALRHRVLAALAPWVDPRLTAASAVQRGPPSFEAYQAFAEGLDYFYRRDSASLERFLHAYALDTTWVTPLLYALWQYDGLGRTAEGDSLLRILQPRRSELAPYDRLVLDIRREGMRANWQGQYSAARAAAELAPQSYVAAYELPRAAIALNRPAEALAYLERIDLDRGEASRLPGYWSMLSASLHMLGKFERQLGVGEEVRRRFPGDTRSYAYRARALAALGRLRELDAVLEESLLLPIEPTWGAVGIAMHTQAADELLAHGHAEHARVVLERALRFCEEAPSALERLPQHRFEVAQVLHRLGRLAEARRLYEELLAEGGSIGAGLVDLRGRIGMAAAGQGDAATARRMEQWLATARGAPGQATEYRAGIRAVLGEPAEAVRLLRQAMAEGRSYDSGKHAYPEYHGLRGYGPFEEWLRPK
ncbi:MAG TPA: AAA family ATPase [Gemmatimonadales bacterium]|nr:AAA family ATPase [Gemmatimonadales bacterium]